MVGVYRTHLRYRRDVREIEKTVCEFWSVIGQEVLGYPRRDIISEFANISATCVAVLFFIGIALVSLEKRLRDFVFGNGPRMSIALNSRESSSGNSCSSLW